MFFYRILLYGLIIFAPIVFFWHGYHQKDQWFEEKVLWYQDFKSNPQFNQDLSVEEFPQFKHPYYSDNNLVVYFSPNGEVAHKVFIDKQSVVSVKSENYIVFQKFGNKLDYYNAQGRLKWSHTSFTYPKLSPNRNNVFLVTTDNTIVSMIDSNQKELLAPTYVGTFITDISFCPSTDNVVIGTMDGKVFFFGGEKGDKKFEHEFQSSQYNYVKSVACSSVTDKVLVLNGLKQEKLTLFDNLGRLLWTQNTGVERRTKTSLLVDEANNLVYDERNGSIQLLDLTTGELKQQLVLDKPPKYTLFSSSLNYLLVGANQGDTQEVILYDLTSNQVKWRRIYDDKFIRYVELKKEGNKLSLLVIFKNKVYAYQLRGVGGQI